MYPGDSDIAQAVDELAQGLPAPLQPLAGVAYDYRWSWSADGADVFREIDPVRWERCEANPRRLLSETPPPRLRQLAGDAAWLARVERLAQELRADRLRAPWCVGAVSAQRPVAFCCAEFGVHRSLPIYSGGLGVLAGDILKEASDLALPMVGVGLMYRTGYFHQRLDITGFQHEYWLDTNPERLPCVLVRGADGQPLTVTVPVDDEELRVRIWRADVGRVPLYLLDTDIDGNSQVGRWVTSRLYESNRAIRLAQYAVLGVGGVRALRAMGIAPAVYHLNEGHPALGLFELLEQAGGAADAQAWRRVREQLVFTTHTPVPAGNETYERSEVLAVLGHLADRFGEREQFVALGRVNPADTAQPSGMTVLAMRHARQVNGVSRRHGEVARAIWQPLFGGRSVGEVPIGHVTNGVHVPTWLHGPMRALLDRHLGAGWMARADQPDTWAPVQHIPPAELWAARCAARAQLIELVKQHAANDRLRRGEALEYVQAADSGFDPERLTVGFARRLATYKRLHLVALQPERAAALIWGERAMQFVFAGKAHPADDIAKDVVRQMFVHKRGPTAMATRSIFLEDYDISLAGHLVAGCDVWVNLPRPPNEASGTSGMKSVLGGGLQLSVLDGWWAEAYDGSNGWAIDGTVDRDLGAQDWRDADALYGLYEQQVAPMFYERDAGGIPQRWVAMIKRSLMTHGPRFSATRMVREYAQRIYAAAPGEPTGPPAKA